MNAHLLSVIIPTHDRADRVLDAAASVLAQEGAALEVIIVDDGSTDSTPEALDALAGRDRRVRVLRNPEPLGPCEARNHGVAVASGDFIATCDDDDAWLPGAAAAMLGYLDDHAEVGAATAWHQVARARSVVDFRGPLVYGSHELLWSNVAAIPFIVVRREAFSSDPWYDPAIAGGEDWELCLRCALERPFRTVPACSTSTASTADPGLPAMPSGTGKYGPRWSRNTAPSCLRPASPTTALSWSS